MRTREWIGDVRVEAGWNIHTGKREWGVWIPSKSHSSYVPESNMQGCGQYATKPEAMKEAKKIAKSRTKRKKDKDAQWAYFQDHPYCEVCLAEGRGQKPADDVHEILYRSQGGKCVPENEISTCRPDHDRMHFKKKPYLTREQLLEMKSRVGKGREKEVVFGAKGGLAHLQKEVRLK